MSTSQEKLYETLNIRSYNSFRMYGSRWPNYTDNYVQSPTWLRKEEERHVLPLTRSQANCWNLVDSPNRAALCPYALAWLAWDNFKWSKHRPPDFFKVHIAGNACEIVTWNWIHCWDSEFHFHGKHSRLISSGVTRTAAYNDLLVRIFSM